MSQRIVVDPVTRIEGHLRIEADYENGVIKNAYSTGTAVRAIEKIVEGRDPRDVWAFVQRICGVCTTTHALASVRAVEDALGIVVPKNASLIREIMNEAQFAHDHVVHFYHLHALDWVDIVSTLNADPNETSTLAQSISDWPKSSPGYFKDVQNKVKRIVESGQLGLFANGYWGHSAYKLPAEVNLLAVAHYLEALEWQKTIVRIHTVLGGKNPHPHYLVGGMATPIDINKDNSLNAENFARISTLITQAQEFVEKVYIPDLLAIGSFYKDWLHGGGVQNHICYGDFSTGDVRDVDLYRMPRGAILNGDLSTVYNVDLKDPEHIREFIDHSWYSYQTGKGSGLHPWDGETSLNYTGPKSGYKQLDTDDKYSWVKAPRWKGHVMDTGPLSRMLVGYASGKEDIKAIVDDTLKKLDIPVTALQSALGRTVARGLETKLVVGWLRDDFNALMSNIKNGDQVTFTREKWDPKTWPKTAQGVGTVEAPRGSLGHWITIEDEKTKAYQAVVPSTWSASPKDNRGNIGPYEAALQGTPVEDPNQPIEMLRIIHSFDPCLACAVHLTDKENNKSLEIKIV